MLDLKRLGVVLKRAQHFIICSDFGLRRFTARPSQSQIVHALLDPQAFHFGYEQLSMFSLEEGVQSPNKQVWIAEKRGEAAECLLRQI